MSSSEPDRTIDCCGLMLMLEQHGEYIEVRQPDEHIMVRFKNFQGIAIVPGEPEIARRRRAEEWTEKLKAGQL